MENEIWQEAKRQDRKNKIEFYLIAAFMTTCVCLLMFFLLKFAYAQDDQYCKVVFGWDANSESYLKGYRLYWGTEPGNYTNSKEIPLADLSDHANPEYTLKGLRPGKYYFVLTAYSENAESDHSNELNTELGFILEPVKGFEIKEGNCKIINITIN